MSKLKINIAIVAAVSFVWASVYWLGSANLWQVERFTSLELYKPWVYRQLVPALARLLALTGIRIDLALVLIVTLSGIGFYLALRALIYLFYIPSAGAELLIVGLVCMGLLLFGYERIPYDLMTAFLITLALYLFATGNWQAYTILFPLVCLNRETAFLLIPFTALVLYIGSPEKWKINRFMIIYQVMVYGLITIVLRVFFMGNGGEGAWLEPWQNIQRFAAHPLTTLLHLLITGLIMWMVAYTWLDKPVYLRLAFIVFAPILSGLYLVAGQAFEVRVFWEVYPVTCVLIFHTIRVWTEVIKFVTFSHLPRHKNSLK